MKTKINMAVIGLGQRGTGLIKGILLKMSDVNIVSVCDEYEDRVADMVNAVKEKNSDVKGFTDYKKLFEESKIDAVLVSTSWQTHLKISLYALERGVTVAMEVGCSYAIEELWELVRTQERTGTPLMFMENCCFNDSECLATSMARKGLFGTIVHMEGAYAHDLREEISGGYINRHYRLDNYIHRNLENYPTHEIGPIAKLLDINSGNRFISLVSSASKSVGLKEYIESKQDKYSSLNGITFNQGDIVSTIIKCANGETVSIKLDTTLPRFYARNFTVRGTKGFYEQNTNLVYLEKDNPEEMWNTTKAYQKLIDNGKNYSQYMPKEWQEVTKEQLESGHGGMDYFEFKCFIDCVKNEKEMPIDVYDAATWLTVSALSEQSIIEGGAPQTFPDFTCGKWITRKRKDVFEF